MSRVVSPVVVMSLRLVPPVVVVSPRVVPPLTIVSAVLVMFVTSVSAVFVVVLVESLSVETPAPVLTSPPPLTTELSTTLVVVSPPVLTVAVLPPPSTNTPSIKPFKIASASVMFSPGKTVLADTAVSVPDKLTIAALPAFAFAAAAFAA